MFDLLEILIEPFLDLILKGLLVLFSRVWRVAFEAASQMRAVSRPGAF
jgi:hypothetical protein